MMSERIISELRERDSRTEPLPTCFDGDVAGVRERYERGSLWMGLAGCGIVLAAIAAAAALTEERRTCGTIGRLRERIRELREE
jgi:hypothetical protein